MAPYVKINITIHVWKFAGDVSTTQVGVKPSHSMASSPPP
jgi:hypothetical protein